MNLGLANAALLSADVVKVFNPQSPQARAIFDLAIVTAIVMMVIFAVVVGIVAYALLRFPRWREGERDPEQGHGNKTVEIVWTAIPFAIVVILFVLAARTMGISDPPPPPKPDILVIGHQWWWEARYANSGVVIANEIHIPVGKPLALRLDSVDVLHEFWVPELARKITTVPGHPNHIWIQADKPGTYLGFCSEFCGTQHAWMHLLVVAEPQAEFKKWEQTQLAIAPSPTTQNAQQGLALFQQLSCVNCHAIKGTIASAQIGPDLTHFASRKQLGAGIAANTPENLRHWLRDPQQVKVGVKMPDFKFNDQQITALADYLETLK
ncbi:MAG TPA: cytochrome c oxidase subunit II [Candidatus Udaeobacter sp.]|nr:cytochrome c oxidase subunit II [Candidatus Udaeobacter sp.]